MMKLTDIIFAEILKELDQSEGTAIVSRNGMAQEIGCVPSQISYVITSRFTPERGYTVESRRGGGGFIRITKVHIQNGCALSKVIQMVGEELDEAQAEDFLEQLLEEGYISKKEHDIIFSATRNYVLRQVAQEVRNKTRALLLKNMLLVLADKEK